MRQIIRQLLCNHLWFYEIPKKVCIKCGKQKRVKEIKLKLR